MPTSCSRCEINLYCAFCGFLMFQLCSCPCNTSLCTQLERNKQRQRQQAEVQSVIARYRGPLLESAIDLEQRLWHLATDQCFDQG